MTTQLSTLIENYWSFPVEQFRECARCFGVKPIQAFVYDFGILTVQKLIHRHLSEKLGYAAGNTCADVQLRLTGVVDAHVFCRDCVDKNPELATRMYDVAYAGGGEYAPTYNYRLLPSPNNSEVFKAVPATINGKTTFGWCMACAESECDYSKHGKSGPILSESNEYPVNLFSPTGYSPWCAEHTMTNYLNGVFEYVKPENTAKKESENFQRIQKAKTKAIAAKINLI